MQALIDQFFGYVGSDALLRQLFIWLSALSAFVLVLGGSVIALGYLNPTRRRVNTLAGQNVGRASATKPKSGFFTKTALAIDPIAAFVLPQDQLERSKVKRQLYRAGFRSHTAMQTFYVLKLFLLLVLPLIVLMVSAWIPSLSSDKILLYSMMAAGVGMLGPNIVLEKLEKKHARLLTNGFPDALDLLVVCVESGLGLAAAIQRVADEINVSHPELAYELNAVNVEIRAGVPREKALKNLADRTGLEDIRGLVGLLVQTMRFGTGVADTLRVYSEEFRDRRTQKAEEQAAKMGTKLVFPLVLFMFPIFFIVAIGPAVIRIMDAFAYMGQ